LRQNGLKAAAAFTSGPTQILLAKRHLSQGLPMAVYMAMAPSMTVISVQDSVHPEQRSVLDLGVHRIGTPRCSSLKRERIRRRTLQNTQGSRQDVFGV
jgi:hypothetical protein